MSHFHSDAEIERVARGLIDRSLPKSEWTHAAHFASALWLLKRGGSRALGEKATVISAYNETTGVANTETSGYHETITLASLRAAHHWLLSRPDAPLCVILGEM